jgi:hypothetical protein
MQFVGMNYLAIIVAAIAAWLAGAAYYMALSKPWLAAQGFTKESMAAARNRPGQWVPFVASFVANLVMAWVLAGLIGHIGAVSLRLGLISGAFCWLGFVITTLAVNYSFGQRDPKLIAIDGGHWLIVLLLEGAVIGGMGVH